MILTIAELENGTIVFDSENDWYTYLGLSENTGQAGLMAEDTSIQFIDPMTTVEVVPDNTKLENAPYGVNETNI